MYKTLFFTLLFVIVVGVVGYFTYNLGQKKQVKNEVTPTSLIEPTVNDFQKPTDIIINEPDIEINENTASYAKQGEKLILRYRNKIYDDSDQLNMAEIKIDESINHLWTGIINAPSDVLKNEFMFDEVFGFLPVSGNSSFIFIMRWGTRVNDQVKISYYLYHYDINKSVDKLTLLNKFDENYSISKYAVPKIDSVDNQGKYLALKMFGCWNCGGHPPETLLMNLETREMKNIGKTSYFAWKENGAYEYKDYKEIECSVDSMGPCSEKPENLPLKTGQY